MSLILAAAYFAIFFISRSAALESALLFWGASAFLAITLIALSIIDLRTFLLPDALTLPLIVAGLLWHLTVSDTVLWSALGAALGYGVIWALGRVWSRLRGQTGIGLGDAKLLAAGGAWLGVFALPLVLTLASGLGLATIGYQRIRHKNDSPTIVAFGPYLAVAIWIVWCARL